LGALFRALRMATIFSEYSILEESQINSNILYMLRHVLNARLHSIINNSSLFSPYFISPTALSAIPAYELSERTGLFGMLSDIHSRTISSLQERIHTLNTIEEHFVDTGVIRPENQLRFAIPESSPLIGSVLSVANRRRINDHVPNILGYLGVPTVGVPVNSTNPRFMYHRANNIQDGIPVIEALTPEDSIKLALAAIFLAQSTKKK